MSIVWVFRRHWHPEVRWYARPRALLLILAGYETEICGRCGGKVGLVWHAPDELWWRLSGYPTDAGVLCERCFDERARREGEHLCWECADGTWPSCAGNPCPHEETMMIVAGHRDEYWRQLQAARNDGEDATPAKGTAT